MKIKKIVIGISALTGFGVLASVIIVAVLPPVYQSKTVTIMDGSSGFFVLGDHQAYAVNAQPDRSTPRVDLIGNWSVLDNVISIEAPAPIMECNSMKGQMHWNRIDWKIESEAMQPPVILTDTRVFLPWSVFAISRQIHKKPNKS